MRPIYHLCKFLMNICFLNSGQVLYLNMPVTVLGLFYFTLNLFFSYWQLGCLYMGSLVVNAPDKREHICIEVY
jgi:hypothetical protein